MADLINSFIGSTLGNLNSGSAIANSVSAAAQQAQMQFNADQATLAFDRQKQLAQMQQAYNSGQAALTNQYNKEMWERQAAFSAAEAQKNRDFQERMSNTAYQRAVKDMITAGINPVLAASQGGASTPGGATGSASLASGATASTSQGSVSGATAGSYTGQGNNMSEDLAMFGAIASMLGQGLSGLANSFDMVGMAKSLGEIFKPGVDAFKDFWVMLTGEDPTDRKTGGDNRKTQLGQTVQKTLDKEFPGLTNPWDYRHAASKEKWKATHK